MNAAEAPARRTCAVLCSARSKRIANSLPFDATEDAYASEASRSVGVRNAPSLPRTRAATLSASSQTMRIDAPATATLTLYVDVVATASGAASSGAPESLTRRARRPPLSTHTTT
jgi:hypothetical protein